MKKPYRSKILNINTIYQNYIFIRVGIINSKIYRGSEELDHFKNLVKEDGKKYVDIANQFGFYGKSIWTIGTDPVEEVYKMVKKMMPLLPNPTFFGGQMVFSKTFYLSQLLHNHTIFSIQKRFINSEYRLLYSQLRWCEVKKHRLKNHSEPV